MSGKATRAANRRSVSLKIAEDSSVDLPSFAALPTLSRTHLEPARYALSFSAISASSPSSVMSFVPSLRAFTALLDVDAGSAITR